MSIEQRFEALIRKIQAGDYDAPPPSSRSQDWTASAKMASSRFEADLLEASGLTSGPYAKSILAMAGLYANSKLGIAIFVRRFVSVKNQLAFLDTESKV